MPKLLQLFCPIGSSCREKENTRAPAESFDGDGKHICIGHVLEKQLTFDTVSNATCTRWRTSVWVHYSRLWCFIKRREQMYLNCFGFYSEKNNVFLQPHRYCYTPWWCWLLPVAHRIQLQRRFSLQNISYKNFTNRKVLKWNFLADTVIVSNDDLVWMCRLCVSSYWYIFYFMIFLFV